MSEDTPEDLVHELLMLAHYGDQPVARPILGTEESVSGATRDDLSAYWGKIYRPQNAVLSVAGHYDWEDFLAMTRSLLGDWKPDGLEARSCETRAVSPRRVARDKDIEQMHICLGYPGLPMGDDKNYELSIFNSVFGGAMSSRLFQRIREESGLAYSVYSYPNAYTDTGMLSVYAATNPDQAEKVVGMILEEARALAENGLTPEEFTMAREQLKSGYILGLESTSARMHSNGRRLLLMNRTRTETETIDRINAVKPDDVNRLARELLTAPHSMALVGRGAEKLAEKL